MDMIATCITRLISCLALDVVAYNDSQLDEQPHRIVERWPAHGEVFLLDKIFSQLLNGEMSTDAIYCL